jgi:hypothetical protein
MLYDAVQFLKSVGAKGLPGGAPQTYVFDRGWCHSQNAATLAAYPTPELASTFALSADALEQILGRLKQQPELAAGEAAGTLVLKKGRLRSTLQIMYADPIEVTTDSATWQPVPAGLVEALRKCLPFISPQGTWQRGVKLGSGHVAAVSSRAAIEIKVPDLDLGQTVILSDECVKYLAGLDDDPVRMFYESGALWFEWDTTAWIRCQLLSYEWGTIADQALDRAGEDAPVVVDDDWRQAVADVIALGGKNVAVGPRGLSSKGDYSVVEAEMDIAVEGVTEWSADILEEVIAVADRWNPATVTAARFYGPDLRGVVVGLRSGANR